VVATSWTIIAIILVSFPVVLFHGTLVRKRCVSVSVKHNMARLASLDTLQVPSAVSTGVAVQLFSHHGNQFCYVREKIEREGK